MTSERDKYETMTVDWDNLKASKELAERRAEHNQERLIQVRLLLFMLEKKKNNFVFFSNRAQALFVPSLSIRSALL